MNAARLRFAALAAGLVLIAINLRPAAAAIGPVLDRIQSDTGLSSGWAGALTTLPVLCFGLLAPLASVLARRFGVRTALAGAMFVLLAGMLLRLLPGVGLLFAGTALAGAAIATGNVLVPVLVRRDFSHRTDTAMALYTVSLIGFAALSAGVTVPLADALGGGWRPGLAVWAIPAAIGALAWVPALVRRDMPTAAARDTVDVKHPARALLRRPLAWAVTLFFALQSLHGISHSWTPPLMLLLALIVPELAIGLAAGRDRQLAPPAAPPPEAPWAHVIA